MPAFVAVVSVIIARIAWNVLTNAQEKQNLAVFRVMNAEDMMVKEPITGENTVDITRLRSHTQNVSERNLRYLSRKERDNYGVHIWNRTAL